MNPWTATKSVILLLAVLGPPAAPAPGRAAAGSGRRGLHLVDGGALKGATQANRRLHQLGLFPLAQGKTMKREAWETLEVLTSPFQEAARELKQGTPKCVQR